MRKGHSDGQHCRVNALRTPSLFASESQTGPLLTDGDYVMLHIICHISLSLPMMHDQSGSQESRSSVKIQRRYRILYAKDFTHFLSACKCVLANRLIKY